MGNLGDKVENMLDHLTAEQVASVIKYYDIEVDVTDKYKLPYIKEDKDHKDFENHGSE